MSRVLAVLPVFAALLVLAALLTLATSCGRRNGAFEVQKKPAGVTDTSRLMRAAKKNPPDALEPERYQTALDDAVESLVAASEDAGADSASLRKALGTVMPRKSKNQVLPTRVVLAKFAGHKAWIIVQNWNRAGSKLSHTRVWVIDVRDQSVLYAASQQ